MARDILKEIVDKRIADMQRLGDDFGCNVPEIRQRPVHPFIARKGAILEIKRASPSKGDIAPNLDAAKTAIQYAKAGAVAISCLTETNYFKGTLTDFMAAAAALDAYESEGNEIPALLRKDFLINSTEVEVAYRAGADAVLLIARILTKETMLEMAKKAEELGISVLIEVRKQEDLEKLAFVMDKVNHKNIVCGVNSRDLKDFTIDMLSPASLLNKIRGIASDARVTFESGILSPESAAFAGSMDFSAILLGEAAAKNPLEAARFTKAFAETDETVAGRAWVEYAAGIAEKQGRPFVKICGLTNAKDALLAAELGADFLGFIFWSKSKRNVQPNVVEEIKAQLVKAGYTGKLVGVIVDPELPESKAAFELCRKGVLDKIQFHGGTIPSALDSDFADIPRYVAANITSESDLDKLDGLLGHGEPRILIDAQTPALIGGTGKRIDEALVEAASKKLKLWIAGGITPENVKEVISKFNPELIDIASGIEKEPGIKDEDKLRKLFRELNR